MGFSYVYCAQAQHIHGNIIKVEVDVTKGMYLCTMVGMTSRSVDESRERVSSAIKNSGFKAMKSRHERVTISLSPAEIKKSGAFFDLAIAVAYLFSIGECTLDPEKKLFIGELSLDAKVTAVSGILAILSYAKSQGFSEAYIPKDNLEEASLISNITLYPIENLLELVLHLRGDAKVQSFTYDEHSLKDTLSKKQETLPDVFSTIIGQEFAKRALLIAASGNHHVCLYGPPGTGKSLLSRAFQTILPHLNYPEVIEVTNLHSIVGTNERKIITRPPLRSPHHSASYAAIVGGGVSLKPGEISLAHRGVLFLDEFPEFDRRVLESLRQPLEDGEISIARSSGSVCLPSQFILVAAMNLCPCGYYGSTHKTCICSAFQISQYQKKISGPIVDRIDLWVQVQNIPYEILQKAMQSKTKNISSSELLEQVVTARKFRDKRIQKQSIKIENLEASREQISDSSITLLYTIAQKLQISPRSYYKLLKVARTIADLEQSELILDAHILEAVQYRKQ